METVITTREFAAIKRVAQNVAPWVQRKAKINEEMKKLTQEREKLESLITSSEVGVKELCRGLGTEQLVHREVEVIAGKFDKKGRPQTKTSYKPNDCLKYDEVKNVYILTTEDKSTSEGDGESMSETSKEVVE